MTGRLRALQDRNEAAISFGTGRHRLVVVAWGPDIGVWQHNQRLLVDAVMAAGVPAGVAVPPPAAPQPDNMRMERISDAVLSYRVPGQPKDDGFMYADRAVRCAMYAAQRAGARCPGSLVLSQWRALLSRVPRWALKFLRSWTGALPVRSEQRDELLPGVYVDPPQRKAPQRFESSERAAAAQLLYWAGPDGRRLLIETQVGWLSLVRALVVIGRGRALRHATKGIRAVLRAAFPKARANHRNRVAMLLQTGRLDTDRLLFWMLAWGRLATHEHPRVIVPIRAGLTTAAHDQRKGAWYRLPVPVLERAAQVLLNVQGMPWVEAAAVPTLWRPEDRGRYDDLDRIALRANPVLPILKDAVHMAAALDGLEELSRIESPARFLDYHRRCGQALGIKLSKTLDPALRFPEPPKPLADIAGDHGDLLITWLCTPALMTLEGSRMGHCVGGAATVAARGEWFYYHLDLGAESATMEVRWIAAGADSRLETARAEINQLYGPRNALVSLGMLRALWRVFGWFGVRAEIPPVYVVAVADGAVDLWEHLPSVPRHTLSTWGRDRAGKPAAAYFRAATHFLVKPHRYTVEELRELVVEPEQGVITAQMKLPSFCPVTPNPQPEVV